MSRPGFVLEVDDKTPALLTMAGAGMRLERFGLGSAIDERGAGPSPWLH